MGAGLFTQRSTRSPHPVSPGDGPCKRQRFPRTTKIKQAGLRQQTALNNQGGIADRARTTRREGKKEREKPRLQDLGPGESAEILLPRPEQLTLHHRRLPIPPASTPQTLCSIILTRSRKSLKILGNEIIYHPLTKKVTRAHGHTPPAAFLAFFLFGGGER